MPLVLHNTLTRKKEPFVPVSPGKVRMYNCGPTVYSAAHIGNFRSFLFADVLRRWLEVSGLQVQQVMNITDVGHARDDDPDAGEDKMDEAARKERLDPLAIADKYAALFPAGSRQAGDPARAALPARHAVHPADDRHHPAAGGDRPRLRLGPRRVLRGAQLPRLRQAVGQHRRGPRGRRARRGSARRSATRATSRCGSRTPTTSCSGTARGAAASPAGTSSARP
jgi:hypothetical protein